MIEVSYDKAAQAVYFSVSTGAVARTEELIEDLAWMDLDDAGRVLGVEFIGIESEAHLEHVWAVLDQHFTDSPSALRENRELLAAIR
jgi:uncharacterized protein YuzE